MVFTFGILSCANIGNKVCYFIQKSEVATVGAVASRSLEKAQEFATRNNIPKAYGTYEELLQDTNIDAVYIPVPTALRTNWVKKAAQAKKHVLCDKPIENEKIALEMIQICRENNVLFMDATMFVHHFRTKNFVENIINKSDEVLGPIKRIYACCGGNLFDSHPEDIRFDPKLEPYGALGDVAWYPIKAILLSMKWKLPSRVFCTAKFAPSGNTKDATAILFYDEHNTTASFDISLQQCTRQYVEVIGAHKYARIDSFCQPIHSDPFEFPENFKSKYNERDCYEIYNSHGLEQTVVSESCLQVVEMIRNFVRLALSAPQGEEAQDFANQTIKTMKVLDACFVSIQNQSIVSIPQ